MANSKIGIFATTVLDHQASVETKRAHQIEIGNSNCRRREKIVDIDQQRTVNTKYPYFIESFYPGHIHQADLVGPRYIKGDGRFYVLNTIDLFSHASHGVPIRSKDDDAVVLALLDTWKSLGVPEFLQVDNELCFRGSNRYPHSLGKVVKLCLSMNMQPIFIPPSEPWRNGVIEHFNDTFDQKFFRTERFQNYQHLKTSLKQFLVFHNTNHIYSANGGKTPNDQCQLFFLFDDN